MKKSELIEYLAINVAIVNNGGEWSKNYNEDQKNHWRKFAEKIIDDCVEKRMIILSLDETSVFQILDK